MSNKSWELNMEVWKSIITAIKSNDIIILHRHILPDGDAIRSQLALKQLINLNFQKKGLCCWNNGGILNILGTMDVINDDLYKDALVIVTDIQPIQKELMINVII